MKPDPNPNDKPFFNVSHPQGLIDIDALSFTRCEELGTITADFLLYFKNTGLQMDYTRYEGDRYEFERSSIGNIFWNDNFEITDADLMGLIKLNGSIILAVEAAYQYWKAHGENNSKKLESIDLELTRKGLEVKAENSANKSLKPTSQRARLDSVLIIRLRRPRPLLAAYPERSTPL